MAGSIPVTRFRSRIGGIRQLGCICRARLFASVAVALLGPWATGTDAATSTSTSLVRVGFLSPTRGVGMFASATAARPSKTCSVHTPTDNGGRSFGAPRSDLVRTKCGGGEAFSAMAFDRAGDLFAYGPG
jgi:hypothetical protein